MQANFEVMMNLQEPIYALPLGDPRRQKMLTVRPNEILHTHTRRAVSLQQLIRLLEPATFILIGELHDNPQHHQFQAQVIEALVQAGRSVIVGMEMFDRTKQPVLNLWTLNRLSEEEFIQQSEWKSQWGFDFALYRPIFEVVYRHRLRLVALNVPRALVRQTARAGWHSIPEAERMGIPDPDLSVEEHRKLFYALLGNHHPAGDASNDNFYAAQVVWDTGMADSALRYLERTVPSPRLAFVILAGNGHVMYDLGISLRLRKRTNLAISTIVPLPPSVQPMQVRAALADFVWLPPAAQGT
ncbi:MAG: ChaN family lipoprotein [Armatimonadota bacterium]|nr:ChaN family lipoprotein [Armatimonadota bacterium]